MLKLKAEGMYDDALKLAILSSEAQDIADARKGGTAAVQSGRVRQFTGQL